MEEDRFPELFQEWYIDPSADADLAGFGPTPTLDVVSSEEIGLVLIYAPTGGGKTFYRRLAAHQIKESRHSECTLEISNIAAHIPNPEHVTTRDLALCVYDQINGLLAKPPLPPNSHVARIRNLALRVRGKVSRLLAQLSPPLGPHVARIFKQCDDIIKRLAPRPQDQAQLYVFIDDFNQLFDAHPSRAEQNIQSLQAILDFCRVAADRGGGEPLALRLFIPEQLREPIQDGLGESRRTRIEECTLSWSVEHCRSAVESRLDSFWEGEEGASVAQLSRLLTPDAFKEFLDWLRKQGETVSPRCVARTLDGLAWYVYGNGVTTEQISVELWSAFVNSGESKTRCVQKIPYPLKALEDEAQPPAGTPTQDKSKYDAFISHSRHDKEWVRDWLLPRLEENGLRICVDFRDFALGAPITTEIEQAVQQSRKTLLVLTPNYLDSEWAEFENILAATIDPAARQRRVIPLLLEQCELPLRIRALTYLDCAESDKEFQLQRLLAAVRSHPPEDSRGRD
ncbi:MAG: toll/interleukin-1 receptor domain-containing protein [Anaerolineae bacterium]|nr:toll/interleukin-1 receptor domain-containing protein [Anaerolineae bacterium]